MGNLSVEKSETSFLHDKRHRETHLRVKLKSKNVVWIIDISSVAIKPQHNTRYMYIRKGVKLEIDFVCLYNVKRKKGYYRFIPHKTAKRNELRDIIKDFIKTIGIDETQIYHDKSFLFGFGVSYHGVSLETQRIKQLIEHNFSFKRWIYRAYKNGEIKTSSELFAIYRKYLKAKNLKEVR